MKSPIAFCNRCRGMRRGWNTRYIWHRLLCTRWFGNPTRLSSLVVLTALLLLAFPRPSAYVFSGDGSDRPGQPIEKKAAKAKTVNAGSPEVYWIDAFLKSNKIQEANRSRLAQSIVTSAKKYDLNPRLIASVMVVESRGNPFAISGQDAVGIMQVHLPTWGSAADREGINLLKIEDNIDFGARILKNYVRQYGLWDGVKRYNGFIASNPISEQSAQQYVAKVQQVYQDQQP
jgi:soluble lytic murein transglycosylase-like protein